jgi:hypothetical protein
MIYVEAEGYHPFAKSIPREGFSVGFFIWDFVAGLWPLVVDFSTGAIETLPESVYIYLPGGATDSVAAPAAGGAP